MAQANISSSQFFVFLSEFIADMDDWDDFQEHDCLVETGARRAPGSDAARTCSDESLSGVFKRWSSRPELLWGVVLRLYYSRWTPLLHAGTFLLAGVLLA